MRIPGAMLGLGLGLVLAGLPAEAVVIRHDRDDGRYVELGARYPAAVAVIPDGTGALISPRWVLTAAHVARGVASRSPRVEVSGREIAVDRIVVHQDWTRMAHDIALFRLKEPVRDVAPVAPYRARDETGQVVTFVGRGDFGTGLTGPQTMDRKKRGATNLVESVDEEWVYFRFDRGEQATQLEGVSGPGDSGGPAFVERDGKLYTVGVSVFCRGEQCPGRYGVEEAYSRVSSYADWIDAVLAGKPVGRELSLGKRASRESRGPGKSVEMTSDLPDTELGRAAGAYLEAFNSNDEQELASFVGGRFAPDYLATRSREGHVELHRGLFADRFGALRLLGVVESQAATLAILCASDKGPLVELRFEAESSPPHRITGIRIAEVSVD